MIKCQKLTFHLNVQQIFYCKYFAETGGLVDVSKRGCKKKKKKRGRLQIRDKISSHPVNKELVQLRSEEYLVLLIGQHVCCCCYQPLFPSIVNKNVKAAHDLR